MVAATLAGCGAPPSMSLDDTAPSAAPAASVVAPSAETSEAQAIAVARETIDDPDSWQMAVAESGPLHRMMGGSYMEEDWVAGLDPDGRVWRVFFVRGDEGIDVVIDYVTGAVLGTKRYIVN